MYIPLPHADRYLQHTSPKTSQSFHRLVSMGNRATGYSTIASFSLNSITTVDSAAEGELTP